MVLEEAREKLGQDSDAFTATRGRPEVRVGQQGSVLDSRGSTLSGAPPRPGRDGEGRAEQSASPSVSPLTG